MEFHQKKKKILLGKGLMTFTRTVLVSSPCWRTTVLERTTRSIPREWELLILLARTLTPGFCVKAELPALPSLMHEDELCSTAAIFMRNLL